MPLKQKISVAQTRGLTYIQDQQIRDGGFTSFSSPSQQPFTSSKKYHTTFVPALILGSLSSSSEPIAKDIRHKLADFLLQQTSSHGSYNYWSRSSKEYAKQPYPDDLDDTFCALSSLYTHDAALVDQTKIAGAVKLLLATETAVGGPYKTWLVDSSADTVWQDIDLAVNSNINYFLSLVSEPLPKLIEYIDRAISEDALVSPYYPSAYSLVYYISRGYAGEQKETLIKKVENLLAAADNSMEQALCLSALLRLDASPDQTYFEKLLAQQNDDGSWPAAAFCIDPDNNGKKHYNGCASLTTAFVLEALNMFSASTLHSGKNRNAHTIEVSVTKQVVADVKKLPADFAANITKAMAKIVQGSNGPEIYGLPTAFNDALTKPLLGNDKTQKLLAQLSLANTYGWLAYTIYDDFLDEEGKPGLLSIANFAHRQSFAYYSDVLPSELVSSTFNTIDAANEWEVQHGRFASTAKAITVGELPAYGNRAQLAERSLGHTLAPLAILHAAGHSMDSAAWKQTKIALQHYLIARQLNDDLHDWQADLQNGQISYVVGHILKDLHIEPGVYDFTKLLTKAQQQFWHHSLPVLCKEMKTHIAASRQAFKKAGIYKSDNALYQKLAVQEASADEALQSQNQAVDFLSAYRKTS